MDSNTLNSLQIFSNEDHPSYLGSGRSKEGLSLFGIMNYCKSPGGKKLLRNWFMRPPIDIQIIHERLNTISFLLEPNNVESIKDITNCLKYIKDIPKILSKFLNATNDVNDWKNLYQTLLYSMKIRELCHSLPFNDLKIFQNINNIIGDHLIQLTNLIANIINFDESKETGKIVILYGVSSELDELKRTYEGLGDFLTNVAKEEMSEMKHPYAEQLHLVYYPQLGCLIAFPKREDIDINLQISFPDMEFQVFISLSFYFLIFMFYFIVPNSLKNLF
jgi:DNA mismatch repair protein MSH5